MPQFTFHGAIFFVWLGCISISLACLLLGVFALIFPGRARGPVSRYARLVLLAGAVGILGADMLAWSAGWTDSLNRFLLEAGVVALGALVLLRLRLAAMPAQNLASIALVVMGIGLASWLTWRFDRAATHGDGDVAAFSILENLELESNRQAAAAPATTDLGRTIPLYTTQARTGDLEAVLARAAELRGKMPPVMGVAVTAPPDSTYNCYGWIFSGGKYFVVYHDVEKILEDNGYEIIRDTKPGDLIVYRDEGGNILHVGLVKATGTDGYVLIESKMGWIGGRILHPPEVQGYSTTYGYYRSPRSGHLLKGL